MHTAGVFRALAGKLIFVLIDSRQYANHALMREWQGGAERNSWCLQLSGRILRNPLALLSKAKERAEAFQFLAAGALPIFPLSAKPTDLRQRELIQKPEPMPGRKTKGLSQ